MKRVPLPSGTMACCSIEISDECYSKLMLMNDVMKRWNAEAFKRKLEAAALEVRPLEYTKGDVALEVEAIKVAMMAAGYDPT